MRLFTKLTHSFLSFLQGVIDCEQDSLERGPSPCFPFCKKKWQKSCGQRDRYPTVPRPWTDQIWSFLDNDSNWMRVSHRLFVNKHMSWLPEACMWKILTYSHLIYSNFSSYSCYSDIFFIGQDGQKVSRICYQSWKRRKWRWWKNPCRSKINRPWSCSGVWRRTIRLHK